ncbi:uncharacterized protein Gasu_41600 [Galdieria sulphuraria]|uniref:Uncharacterized protein n=1 Tax=Galdieria sulphuraria TaxID=130081 RepID=M2XXG0_GALSU|nr:uncharacterized protein Gasu_41600 [Galdieria sulphuraria]EME28313.1 hypothetical protein Gasu_41600 [Galdieria sulphuraria]|eukprot:XP_005704833.1 hypothetical protein Gasu_41600 [Galdieria sulphuraria]
MEKTERDRLETENIASSLSQKCSLLKKEGSKKEQFSQAAQERDMKLHGQLRPLVPFFVPGEETSDGDLKINDTLRVPQETSFKVAAEPKEVIVRTWDKEQGFFEESVHRVTESNREPMTEEKEGLKNVKGDTSVVEVRTKLLTPDSILARASAKKQFLSPYPGGSIEGKDAERKSCSDFSFEREVCRELSFSEQTQKLENYQKGSKKSELNKKYNEQKKPNQSAKKKHSGSPKSPYNEIMRNSNKLEDSEKGRRAADKEYRAPEKHNQKSSRKIKKAYSEEGSKKPTSTEADLNRRFAGSSYDTASPPPASYWWVFGELQVFVDNLSYSFACLFCELPL